MNKRKVFGLVWLCLAFMAAGCAVKRLDLVETGTVKVMRVDSEQAYVDLVNVHQHGEDMEIEVIVRPRERVGRFAPGPVEVNVNDTTGASFNFVHSQRIWDHHHLFSTLQHAHFWVRLPYQPAPGTVIKVTVLDNANTSP